MLDSIAGVVVAGLALITTNSRDGRDMVSLEVPESGLVFGVMAVGLAEKGRHGEEDR